MKVPVRYLPFGLSLSDRAKQSRELRKSRRLYKRGKYYTRREVPSFHSRKSNHITDAKKMYGVDVVMPNPALAKATGCSVSALRKIVRKGEGAYFSSGSRPNQTAQSWGLARLASSVTGGKSAAVDFSILEAGCDHRKRAYTLAKRAKKKYGYGRGHTKRVSMQ
jgi:Family of unknown function (DUF5824)